jgi:hypothetical protein
MNTSQASPSEVIAGLRQQAVREIPVRCGADPLYADAGALGALMETGYEKAVVTLVAVIDGAASLYFSSGGGIICGQGHEDVRMAARRFVQFASVHLSDMAACMEFPLPERGQTTFYVLTREGAFTYRAPEAALGNGADSFSALFHTGHFLLARLRLANERRQRELAPSAPR